MIKYGLISETDARTFEKTIDLIIKEFFGSGITWDGINVTEIGIFDGQTARGIHEYVTSKQYGGLSANQSGGATILNYKCNYTAIDNNKDKMVLKPFPECNLIIGNSNEVYNQLEDNSQHLIFIDGCHCFAHVVSDFFCYAPKVKVGGYLAFHDTGKHIKEFKDFQHGDKNNPDAYISVRKALDKVGLLHNLVRYNGKGLKDYIGSMDLELVFDEADINNEAGGICVFKKLY